MMTFGLVCVAFLKKIGVKQVAFSVMNVWAHNRGWGPHQNGDPPFPFEVGLRKISR